MSGKEHRNKIVIKPWGYEYLVYENDNVALWHLHINQGESTSMHCHPTKTTGLIVLSGEAEVSFLADKRIIKAVDKVMIRRGLFHQTKALSEGGVDIFEVETPNDKDDLVRLEDNYGRQDKPYETTYKDKDKECLWFGDNSKVWFSRHFKGLVINVWNVNHKENLMDNEILDDDNIVVFLKGGLKRDIGKKSLCAIAPGDVGFFSIVKQVAQKLDGIMPETVIMTISKDEE